MASSNDARGAIFVAVFFSLVSLTAGEICDDCDSCCYSGFYHCCYGAGGSGQTWADPGNELNVSTIALSVTGIVAVVVIVFVVCCCSCRRRREHAGTVVSTRPQPQVTMLTVPQGTQGVMMAPQPGTYPNGLATPGVNQQQAFPQQLAPGASLQPPPYQPRTAPLAGPSSAAAHGSNSALSDAPANLQPPPYQPRTAPLAEPPSAAAHGSNSALSGAPANLQPPPYQPQTSPLAGPPSAAAHCLIPALSGAQANTEPPPYQHQATPKRQQSDDSYIYPVSPRTVQTPPTSGGYINAGLNDNSDNQHVGQVGVSQMDDVYEEPSSPVHV